jgi:hypothetical protein
MPYFFKLILQQSILSVVISLTVLSSFDFNYIIYDHIPIINYIIGLLSILLFIFFNTKYKNHKQYFIILSIVFTIIFVFFHLKLNLDKGFLPTACLNLLISLAYVMEDA